jgi:putative drug exporter of the RND superfamily
VSLAGVGVVAHFFTTPNFAGQVASMIGIGVGIDYALFIVTRYREALHRGESPEGAVVEAMTTSGRAVVFAAFTVMVSVLGMFLMGIPFLDGLAVGISVSVAIAVLAAATLLPALLGFAGHTIDRLRVPHRHTTDGETFWHRWSRTVQRRPRRIAIAGFGILIVLALPALHMRLGVPDASNNPPSSTTRQAYDLIERGFGPGANGPLVVVAEAPREELRSDVTALVAALRATPGVAAVSPAQIDATGAAAVAALFPTTGPQDARTASLVHHLRDRVVPDATRQTGMRVHLGGQTASAIDSADLIGRRLPIFIAAVLALSFLLLLAVFRSVLVPLKAVLMNLLSIGAAYGIIVAAFQWGWGAGLLGISAAPIAPWIPMMLFAVVFGMSMDYEVFLLSAVREHYDRSHDNSSAVAEGLSATARVITAAALIMVCVFGSFVSADTRDLKVIGLGLAVAIAVDATIVRVFLVPATMELLGDANWWLPGRVARWVPQLRIENQRDNSRPTPVPAGLIVDRADDARELVGASR